MSLSEVEVRQTIGHLAAAPELIYVGQGENRIARTTMVVISNKIVKDRESGETRETATRIRWTLWRQQAENAAKYLSKGSAVSILGRVENNDYEHDGEQRYDLQFTVNEIKYLDTKAAAEARAASRQGQQGQQGQQAPAARPQQQRPAPNFSDMDDDIPY